MGWGFRVTCPDCRHEWEGVETHCLLGPSSLLRGPDPAGAVRSWFCPRCYFRLVIPRVIGREAWATWYEAFLAGPAAYPFLRDVARRLDEALAAGGDSLRLAPVDCPECRRPFEETGTAGSDPLARHPLVCPRCRGRGAVIGRHDFHCSLLGDRHGFS